MYRLLKFGAQWCGPCRQLSKELASNPLNLPNVTLNEIDIDEAEDLAEVYRITNIPTLVLKNEETGDVLFRHVGYITREQLIQKIKEVTHAE